MPLQVSVLMAAAPREPRRGWGTERKQGWLRAPPPCTSLWGTSKGRQGLPSRF